MFFLDIELGGSSNLTLYFSLREKYRVMAVRRNEVVVSRNKGYMHA